MMDLPTWVYICGGVWFSLDITMFVMAVRRATRDKSTIVELAAEVKKLQPKKNRMRVF